MLAVTQVTPARNALAPIVVVVGVHVVPLRTSIVPPWPVAMHDVVLEHVMSLSMLVVPLVIGAQLTMSVEASII